MSTIHSSNSSHTDHVSIILVPRISVSKNLQQAVNDPKIVDYKMDQIVWIPDPEEGFVLAKIVDMNADSVTAKTMKSPTRTIQAAFSTTFPKEENDTKEVNDNCALMFLNEATLLNNLRLRYNKDKIYVSSLS